MVKKVLTILTTVLIVLAFNASAFADTLTDKQNQLENVQGKIDNTKDTIDDLVDKMQEQQKQISTLDSSISKVDKDISDMQTKIKDTQNKIDVTTRELNKAIDEYNKQNDAMNKRIKTLYENGTSIGYLEILFDSTSFSDFITRADVIKKIADYDINLLKEMENKREAINNKKVELENSKAQLVSLKSGLDSNKNTLVKQKKDRSVLVASLSKEKSNYESILKQEEATAEQIKKEIKSLLGTKVYYDGSKWAILHLSDFPSGARPRITSPFGYRTDPITGQKAYHEGLDIGTGGVQNIPVYAMAPGKVIIARYYGGYGYAVVIDHGNGLSTLYGHNNKLLVSEGQIVKGGQNIALSGSTGRSTGPHVHFGVQINGENIDPAPYYMLGN